MAPPRERIAANQVVLSVGGEYPKGANLCQQVSFAPFFAELVSMATGSSGVGQGSAVGATDPEIRIDGLTKAIRRWFPKRFAGGRLRGTGNTRPDALARTRAPEPMANIYDVARQASVSVATVSAVINESAYVSPQLKRRVTAAIKKLAYQPNLLARSLAKQRSHMLGMIVPDIVNPFWPEVVRGAEDRAHSSGYTLLLANTDDDSKKEELYLDLFLAKRVDGILLTKAPGTLAPEIVERLERARVPVVQVSRVAGGLPEADAVLMDDREAAYEAVSHLLRLGYRKVAMIGGLAGATPSDERLAGYRQALKAWKRPFERSFYYQGDYRVHSGYAAGIALLKKRPDAIFISNYQMAVGFMKALRQYQLRCPQDVAIVTCDDHPWIESFQPRLTTVDLPKYELGAEGAQVLIDRLAARDAPRQTVQLPSALTIRDSCGYALRTKAV